jgi:predicted amidohydrolase
LVQPDIAWQDKAINYERVRQMLDRADVHAGDLVLLPEMYDTGFSFMLRKQMTDGRTLSFPIELAQDTAGPGRSDHRRAIAPRRT